MITLEELLARQKNRKAKPRQEDLRKLPCKKAFIYGRVSSPDQVRDSKESIREIAKMVALAKSDGYQSNITAEEIESWLLSIQQGSVVEKIVEDGGIIVNVQDLGISAKGLADEKREGLAHLRRRLESGEIGAVYVTEGVSRLSRDQDRILPFQLLKLFKEQQCRLRTPDGVWNPAIERDWEHLAEEFEDAAKELKVLHKRMHRRKAQKADRGEYVGEPIPAGFILPILGHKPNGEYEFGKLEPYPPHVAVVIEVLRELVRHESPLKSAQAVNDLTFPLFPKQLAYMETRSALRRCPRTPSGYRITPALVKGLATNPKLVGVWQWGDCKPVLNNHEAIVPDVLFLKAYAVATRAGKPKGRAVNFEPLEWAGLLWCVNGSEPRLISSHSTDGHYVCDRDYQDGQGPICLDISARFIDEPLTTEVLRQLDFTPYAEELLVRLEAQAIGEKVEETQYKRQITELQRRMEQLRSYLGCGDPEREEVYWEQYTSTKQQFEELQGKPPPKRSVAIADVEKVRDFLAELPRKWQVYPRSLRNRLLKLLIERVELRHEEGSVTATIIWRAGFEQQLRISWPRARSSRDRRWTNQEDSLLKLLWPSSSAEVVQAAFADRSWNAIAGRAFRLRIKREREYHPPNDWRPWAPCQDEKLKSLYEAGIPLRKIASELGRSINAVESRASVRKLVRPAWARWKKAQVTWGVQSLKAFQRECQGR